MSLKWIECVTDSTLVNLLFPRRCVVCDNPVNPYGKLICHDCAKTLRYVRGPRCYKCGKPLSDETMEYCDDCKRHEHEYISGMALFEYKTVADSIYRFKYRGRREYAKFYGGQLALVFGMKLRALKIQAIVPVPIHKSKMHTRGYNQAKLLADELSKHTKIPVIDNLVIRNKKTVPLKDLSPAERNNNLRGAFKIGRNGVKLETIIIIDDIYTTGATVDEISRLLHGAGIANVYFLSLAIGQGV